MRLHKKLVQTSADKAELDALVVRILGRSNRPLSESEITTRANKYHNLNVWASIERLMENGAVAEAHIHYTYSLTSDLQRLGAVL